MASTTIGALNVRISADNRGFKDAIKDTQKDLTKTRRALNDNAVAFAKWGATGVVAAAGIGAALFKSSADNVRELKNLSFAANTLTEDFQRGAFAAQQFGIEQQKYGDILKDVNDRIGDFVTTGGGPMLDFFEQVAPKVGVTADAFRGLSGQEALGLFVKSLQDANLSQEEMTFHMEAMASDATMLLPLFKDNAEALKAMSEEAKALGIGLSAVDSEQIEQASRAMDTAGAAFSAIAEDLTVEFAPVIKVIADSFTDAAKEGKGFGNEIKFASDLVINSIGFVMDAVEGVKRTFQVLGKTVALVVLGIQEGMLRAADFIVNRPVEAVNELIDALNTLPWHNIDPVEMSGFGETIKTELDIVTQAISSGVDDIAEVLNKPMPSNNLKSAVEAVRMQSQAIAEENQKRKDAEQEEQQAAPRVAALQDETKAILEELQKRYASEKELQAQKFIEEQEALALSRENGLIGEQEHLDLVRQLNADHVAALDQMKFKSIQDELTGAANKFNALAQITTLGGKKTEKATKNISIAQALIKGGESAVSAFAAGMSTGGPWAPATAALYTAASIANTTRMIQSIRNGGKSKARPSASVPRAAAGGNGTATGDGQQAPQQRIDISLAGEAFFSSGQVRQLIEQINEQTSDGVQLNAILGA